MEILTTVVLGVIQGLTEFLPVSSSGHLVLLPWIMDFKDPGLTFDVALHLGTLVALLAFFGRDWWKYVRAWFVKGAENKKEKALGLSLLIACVPAVLAGLLFQDLIDGAFRSPLLVALNLAVFGVLLWVADRMGKKNKEVETVSFKDAMWIGLAQVLSLVPGVSRAGITISAGLALGLNRVAAARYSFLLAVPITAGACVFGLRKIEVAQLNLAFVLGVVVAAAVGMLAIKFMLKFLAKADYKWFAVYRIVLAVLIVVLFLTR